MRGKQIFFMTWAMCGSMAAQTVINGSRAISGTWDAGGAMATRPAKTGTALPGTCGVGEVFFKTDAPAGQNLHLCSSADVWTAIEGGGSSSSSEGPKTVLYASRANLSDSLTGIGTFAANVLIPAGTLKTSSTIRVHVMGATTTDSSGTLQPVFRVSLCGVPGCASGPVADLANPGWTAPVVASQTNQPWALDVRGVVTEDGALGKVDASTIGLQKISTSTTQGIGWISQAGVDTTVNQYLSVRQTIALSGDTVALRLLVVEVLEQ